jgi:hypothetical protein
VKITCKENQNNFPMQPELSLNIYPNPSTGIFTLSCNSKKQGALIITVYDILGKVILEKNAGDANGTIETSLDLSSQPEGEYLIRIKTNTETQIRKVQVVR